MKVYKKPEFEIVEFHIPDLVAAENSDGFILLSDDEVFYGDDNDTGYLVNSN